MAVLGWVDAAAAPPAVGTTTAVTVELRDVRDEDLDELFEQMRDPEGIWMAAFTAEDPDDREYFDAHMARVRAAPDVTMRAITLDGRLVGHVASFDRDGETEETVFRLE